MRISRWYKGKEKKVIMPVVSVLAAGLLWNVPVMAAELPAEEVTIVEDEEEEIPMPEKDSSGTCGTNVNYSFNSTTGIMTISGTGAMQGYGVNYATSKSTAPWSEYAADIKILKVQEGVTSIGSAAFFGCENLSKIELPSTLTVLNNQCFQNCKAMTAINLPSGLKTIGDSVFRLWGLTKITIPNTVTDIGSYAFYGCKQLQSANVPNGITNLDYAVFSGCSALSKLDIPTSVKTISNEAFMGCSALKAIVIPEGVTSIGESSFSGCSGLSELKIPSTVKTIKKNAFTNCKGLTSFEIPATVTSIGTGLLQQCDNLTTVTLPATWTTIPDYMFSSCKNLTNITIPENVTTIGREAFSRSGLTGITIPSKTTSIHTSSFENCSELEAVIVACDWKSIEGYQFDAGVTKKYKHVETPTVQVDDEQDLIHIKCNHCTEKPDEIALKAPEERTYTGNPIVAMATTTNPLYMPNLTYEGEKLADGKPVQAGGYTAIMTVDTSDGEKKVSLEYQIDRALSACTEAPAAKSLSYTGEAQTLVDAGMANGGTMYYSLNENGDYKTDIPKGTDAGTYTVYYKVVGDVNHTDTDVESVNVIIAKVDGNVSGEDTYTKTFGQDDFALNIETNHNETELQYEIVEGEDVISLNGNNVHILKAGGATVKVSLPESTNYNGAEKNISINVSKIAGYNVEAINRTYLYLRENADSVNLEALLPTDSGKVEYAVSQTEGTVSYSQAPSVENGILNYKVNSGELNAQGTIIVTVSSDNYENFDVTVNIRLDDRKPVRVKEGTEVTLKNNTLSLGEALSVLEFQSAVFVDEDGNVVEGTLAWKNPQSVPGLEEKSATWVFTPDSVDYAALEGTVAIVVEQITDAPNKPQTVIDVPFTTRKVSEVSLPEGWTWKVEDADKALRPEEPVTVTAVYTGADSAKYTEKEVTVTITRAGKEWTFTDVAKNPGQWKYEAVKYVYNNDIMNGISGTTEFRPDIGLNRAMFATVLYRMAGSPQVAYEDVFTDVKAGKYYSEAVLWAKQKGIVNGFSDGTYGVDTNITREQIAKMLYEYASKQGYDVSGKAALDAFTDKENVSGWATGYMQWAVDAGMISGKPNGDETFRLDPKGNATRAECAKMLKYFIQKYE